MVKAESVNDPTIIETLGSKKMIPVKPRASKILEIVNKCNERDEKSEQEQAILNGKVKK